MLLVNVQLWAFWSRIPVPVVDRGWLLFSTMNPATVTLSASIVRAVPSGEPSHYGGVYFLAI